MKKRASLMKKAAISIIEEIYLSVIICNFAKNTIILLQVDVTSQISCQAASIEIAVYHESRCVISCIIEYVRPQVSIHLA